MTMMITMTMTMMMTKKHPAQNARFIATSLSFSALFTMVAGLEISNQLLNSSKATAVDLTTLTVSEIAPIAESTSAAVVNPEVAVAQSDTAATSTTTTVKKNKKKKARNKTTQPESNNVTPSDPAVAAPAPEPQVVTVVEVAPAPVPDATSSAS